MWYRLLFLFIFTGTLQATGLPISKVIKQLPKAPACLITNKATSGYLLLQRKGNSSALHREFARAGKRLYRVFTPEHGLDAREEGRGNSRSHGVRVTSLHKTSVKQMLSYFKYCAIMIYDLPDVGVRPYTYRTILTRSMRATELLSKKWRRTYWVIDRPNPASHLGIIGPLAVRKKFTYLGEDSIPFFPSKTQGEIARLFKGKHRLKLRLRVLKLPRYRKTGFLSGSSSSFRAPSPNIPSKRAMYCYWVSVLLEGTTFELGRNTNDPFCMIGAPDLDYRKPLPQGKKIKWSRASFTARWGKQKGKRMYGFRMQILNPRRFNPVAEAYGFLLYLRKHYGMKYIKRHKQGTYALDELTGSDSLRKALMQGLSYWAYRSKERRRVAYYERKVRRYILY